MKHFQRKAGPRQFWQRVVVAIGLSLAAVAACGQDNEAFSEAELDQLLAPVALYPDTLLTHVLIAATYPLEVVMADRWRQQHPNLPEAEAVEAADAEGWDPSVTALVAFPELLSRMSDDLDWTEQLGEAFLDSEAQVLERVQQLRQRAYESGNLEQLEHLTVSRDADHIVIEPVVREVVYVPYYDTRVVYGSWWWDDYPPYYWHHHRHDRRVIYWGPRARVSWHFVFGGFHWEQRRLVVIDHSYRQRYRFRSVRNVVKHHHAVHWRHDPHHRRGVHYKTSRVKRTYDHQPRRRYHADAADRQRVRSTNQPSQRVQRSLDSANQRVKRPTTSSAREKRDGSVEYRASNRESPLRAQQQRDSRAAQARHQQQVQTQRQQQQRTVERNHAERKHRQVKEERHRRDASRAQSRNRDSGRATQRSRTERSGNRSGAEKRSILKSQSR